MFLVLAGLLFLAGALTLPAADSPYPEDLAQYFATDGSWGAGALAVYNLVAGVTNVLVFGVPIGSLVNLVNLGLAVVASLVALTRARRWHILLTLGYVVLFSLGQIGATPAVYENALG